jgi:plastocyanin
VKGRTVPHAIITLVPGETPLPMPDQPAVMDQYAKQFIPSVLISRVGQPVEFRNSEDMPHNVTVSRRDSGSQIFTVGTDPHQKYVHTFDRVGQFDVKCDIHEGMEATLIVARGPLTQITDDKGEFAFPNIPVGLYTLSVTSSNGTVEQPLKVQHGVTMLMGGK